MATNSIRSLPVAPTIWPVVVGPAIRTPAARSARGLMSVRSAPVSSISRAPPLPLILTSTRIR